MSDLEKGFNPVYDDNKKSNTIYVGRENSTKTDKYRMLELIVDQDESFLTEKNKEKDSIEMPFEIDKEHSLKLYCSSGGQIKMHCWLIKEKNRNRK